MKTWLVLSLIVLGCLAALFIANTRRSKAELREQRAKQERLAELASFAAQHGAEIEWAKAFEHRDSKVRTLEIQDVLLKPGRPPVVFIGRLENVERQGDSYYLTLDYSPEWFLSPTVSLRAKCAESLARRLLAADQDFFGPRIALIARVHSVQVPRFEISADGMTTTGDTLAIDCEALDAMKVKD